MKRLREKSAAAELGGGQKRIEAQHKKGKLTARERIDRLLDKNTFEEFDKFVLHESTEFGLDKNRFPGDGVVTGYGKIEGRLVYVYAQDFTVMGGSLSLTQANKICKVMDMAQKNGVPLIALNDSGGARIQEGVASLAGYGNIFMRNVLCSGAIPQITAIMGPAAGGAVYSPALTDFIFMVEKTSYMFITGPEVVRAVIHEDVTPEELGGPPAHSTKSGVAHFTGKDDEEVLRMIRELLSFFPSNNREKPPIEETSDDPERVDENLNTIVPENPAKPYDIKDIVRSVTFSFAIEDAKVPPREQTHS